VAEVDRGWNDAHVSTRDLSLIVDLRNVPMISEVGEEILLRIIQEGVRFICGEVLNRHVLQRLACRL
jgi:hypothetical protein